MADKRIGSDIEKFVRRYYEPIENPGDVDGAQMWYGQWWMPIWGCDTLDHIIDDLPRAAHASEPWTVHDVGLLLEGAPTLSSATIQRIADAHNATLQPAHTSDPSNEELIKMMIDRGLATVSGGDTPASIIL